MSAATGFQLFDTLQGALRPLAPLREGQVSLYVCGPTVYDDAHLGHARCYITWDILFRHLKALGYQVTYVRNVTDVDDKIINRAKSENSTPQAVAAKYFERFSEDMQTLNVLQPTQQPKATEHVPVMHEAIQALLKKEAAYVTPDGTVYFRTGACTDYGKLSKKPLDDLKAGARVDVDPHKESPLDFALWKSVPAEDQEAYAWDSPWGKGRPGWHIECSAMNYAQFGAQIDIHAGGADLIFPHHENEIAQSECWTGDKPFAKYWMHNGFVNVSGEKMSKSLGNFSTIRKLLTQYDANVIRYFLLQHHYRMPVDFNDEALEGAKNRIRKIYRTLKKASQLISQTSDALLNMDVSALSAAYFEAMADDLNTPKALALFNQSIGDVEQAIAENAIEKLKHSLSDVLALWDVLGFQRDLALQEAALSGDDIRQVIQAIVAHEPAVEVSIAVPNTTISAQDSLESIIALRKDAKKNKNWPLADTIRNQLMAKNIQLMDNKDGTTTYELLQ